MGNAFVMYIAAHVGKYYNILLKMLPKGASFFVDIIVKKW